MTTSQLNHKTMQIADKFSLCFADEIEMNVKLDRSSRGERKCEKDRERVEVRMKN